MSIKQPESQHDAIRRLAPRCVCPEGICLGGGDGDVCVVCIAIDPEWECLRILGAEIEADSTQIAPDQVEVEADRAEVETYEAATHAYLAAATWLTPADAPFRLHALNIARSLDLQMRTKAEVQSALASTYAKVLVLLDKRRPAPTFDPLTQGVGPHGEKSLFGEGMDG